MEPQQVSINLVPAGTQTSDPQFYQLVHPYAIRLRDLHLHRNDLVQVTSWLDELLEHFPQGVHTQPNMRDEAFWTASVITFFRCFTPSSRGQLDSKKVFKGEPTGALQAFDRLYVLRNRTVAHDESFFTQAFVTVPVANPEGPVARVGPIQTLSFRGVAFDFEEISNLNNLAKAAGRWVDAQSLELKDLLETEVRNMSREELVKNGPLLWTSPSFDTADEKRPRI